jgi:hypothetical protein
MGFHFPGLPGLFSAIAFNNRFCRGIFKVYKIQYQLYHAATILLIPKRGINRDASKSLKM